MGFAAVDDLVAVHSVTVGDAVAASFDDSWVALTSVGLLCWVASNSDDSQE
jgi:hypothetical protein